MPWLVALAVVAVVGGFAYKAMAKPSAIGGVNTLPYGPGWYVLVNSFIGGGYAANATAPGIYAKIQVTGVNTGNLLAFATANLVVGNSPLPIGTPVSFDPISVISYSQSPTFTLPNGSKI